MVDENKKKKEIKSISELMKLDGESDNMKFDNDDAKIELQKLEDRMKFLNEYKLKLEQYSKLDNNDYKLVILKELVQQGLMMMGALQKEIESAPTGRDVECISSLMNSINSTIDNINKIDFNKQKMELEKEKLTVKKLSNNKDGDTITQNNIYFSTTDLIDMIKKEKIKTIDVSIEKPLI